MLHIIQSDYRYVKCLKDNLLYKLEMSISTVVVLLDSLLHSWYKVESIHIQALTFKSNFFVWQMQKK